MINVNTLRPAIGDGRKLFVETYGCQMNVGDSELIISILQQIGRASCREPRSMSRSYYIRA